MKDSKVHIVCGVIRLALASLLSWGLTPYHRWLPITSDIGQEQLKMFSSKRIVIFR